jgi:hypothetical protein
MEEFRLPFTQRYVSKNITIDFDQATYTATVTAEPDTFYHIDVFGEIFTNLSDDLVNYFKQTFWLNKVNDMTKYVPKRYYT